MNTLLLRLAAPLQSWGYESKFEIRRTGIEPTKSGVIGMVAAAMGRKRNESVDDLTCLMFGVRIDQPGKIIRDFHMVHKEDGKVSYVTTRYYLSDAVFLAGLTHEDSGFLKDIQWHLQHPAYPLFLGRRSCPPSQPVCIGIREKDLLTALKEEEWLAADWRKPWLTRNHQSELRILIDTDEHGGINEMRKDIPVSYNPYRREYRYRLIKDCGTIEKGSISGITHHDPMRELEI